MRTYPPPRDAQGAQQGKYIKFKKVHEKLKRTKII